MSSAKRSDVQLTRNSADVPVWLPIYPEKGSFISLASPTSSLNFPHSITSSCSVHRYTFLCTPLSHSSFIRAGSISTAQTPSIRHV